MDVESVSYSGWTAPHAVLEESDKSSEFPAGTVAAVLPDNPSRCLQGWESLTALDGMVSMEQLSWEILDAVSPRRDLQQSGPWEALD